MLTDKDREILTLMKAQPDRQMVVESGVICHVGSHTLNNSVHRMVTLMAIAVVESQGALTRYELTRAGSLMLTHSEFQDQILGSL